MVVGRGRGEFPRLLAPDRAEPERQLSRWPPVVQFLPPLPSQPLSAADRTDITRVETYLNGLRTMSARFLQVADNGATAQGQFYLSRPGKLRLEYDPPVPILLVSEDRGFLIHYDKNLRSVAYIPINSTPAGLLVRDKIALSGDLLLVRNDREAACIRLPLAAGKK